MTMPTIDSELTSWRLCRWAVGYAMRRRAAFAVVILMLLVKVGMEVLKPWPVVFLIDYVLRNRTMPGALDNFVQALPGPATPHNLIAWSVGGTVLIFLLSWAAGVIATYGSITLGQRMTYDLAGDLFAKLQQLSLQFHARNSVGDNIRRVTSDCTSVSIIVRDALLPVFSSAVSLVVMFWILWQLDPILAAMSLAVVPAMGWIFWRYARRMMEHSYVQQQAEGEIYGVIEQTFSAIPVVQAFGREDLNNRWFARATRATTTATLELTRVQMSFRIWIGLVTALGTAAILWMGAHHALGGALSVGAIIAFLSYLGSFYAPLESIMYTSSTIQGATGSARRVWEVLRKKRDVLETSAAISLTDVRGDLAMEAVTFGYEPGRAVLRDISLEVRAGEMVALVGATGAGKSTLASLVPRFFDPWEGRVLIDGRDIRDVRLKTLRQHIAIVLQEPFLFPISIAENIRYGCPDATAAQIEAAARAANAHEFIMRLPESYATIVGERGATLSGGERQRISIARALLKDAPILILDEPTSAIDAETEKGLLDALERLIQHRTTLIIAHRLSTVQRADRIVVLKDGRIAESGSHEELLARGSVYAGFHQAQFGAASTQ